MKRLSLAAGLALMVATSVGAHTPMTAAQSDPKVLGWMQGFPPPADKIIAHPDSNYFSFPKLRWSVCHLREFLPTEEISRGLGAPVPLPRLNAEELSVEQRIIDILSFRPIGGGRVMTVGEAFDLNYTDGLLILHRGEVVYERYGGCLDEGGKHVAMSMTKSLTGLLAEILVVEGALDDRALVSAIIPEVAGSAFGSATVREVMDMTTGIQFSEDYSDPDADIWLYSKAASPLPKPADYAGPDGYWEYLQQVQPEGAHGAQFHYKTVNSGMLGWIISRVTGQSVSDLAATRIWSRMGAEQAAYMTVDGTGVPFAGGGLTAGLRDLGRLGLLMLNKGEINGERLFPAIVVENIREGGDPEKFAGFPTLPGASYTSQWWVMHNENGAYAARGMHGQTIYVDPAAEMVLVRFASHPQAKNGGIDPTSLPAYQAIADYLSNR